MSMDAVIGVTARDARSNGKASERTAGKALTLDGLLQLSPDELRALYEQASVPELSKVQGPLRGRMLAWDVGPRWFHAIAKAWASTKWFVWKGKSFAYSGEGRGSGINRVLVDAFLLFRFTTFVGGSRAGAFDAVQLDYDHASNPFFIRVIKDEIRELSPGLYLGQAYLHVRGRDHLVLYFGLTERGRP